MNVAMRFLGLSDTNSLDAQASPQGLGCQGFQSKARYISQPASILSACRLLTHLLATSFGCFIPVGVWTGFGVITRRKSPVSVRQQGLAGMV